MLTRDFVLEAVRSETTHKRESCAMLDARDFGRLCGFFPVSEWVVLGFCLKEGEEEPEVEEWSEEVILEHLKSDLRFSFEKAMNGRGISSSLMYDVVKMWLWILEDDLHLFPGYEQYGLPFFREVALKYGLPNPLGSDRGDESKYGM